MPDDARFVLFGVRCFISSWVFYENFFTEVAKFETQAWYTGTKKNIFQVIDNKAFFIDLA